MNSALISKHPRSSLSRPNLVHTANLWTLAGHPTSRREWSLASKLKKIEDAGFDAVTAPASDQLHQLIQRRNLRYMGFFSASEKRTLAPLLEAQIAVGAELTNVQLGDDFTPVAEGTRLALALQAHAERHRAYAAIEVHRDTATETPEKTYAIADAYHQKTGKLLPITWDHSHFAVVKHLKPFLFEKILLRRPELIQNARILHLRPFNGQHAQVPVTNGKRRLTPEFRDWLKFVRALFQLWLAGPRPGNELWVCPEIGPRGIHGYNLSTMPPAWPEAQRCRIEISRLWKELNASSPMPSATG